MSIAIAGAGCALAVLGVLIVAGDTGSSDNAFNRTPGILLSALVVAGGYVVLASTRRGPLATAGAVAAALGVPPFMFFVTFDQNGLPPYSTDAILIVSTVVWLGTYAVGAGRGRPFFLGAGLIGLWFTALQLVEQVFEAPYGAWSAFGAGFESTRSDVVIGGSGFDGGAQVPSVLDGPTFHMPDPTTIGLLSLGLGVAYLLGCRWLDTRGHAGAATPFAFATLPTLAAGATSLADDLEQAGTGLLIMVLGGALAWHGASSGRRITAWLGGGAAAAGAAIFLADMTDDATVGGMLFVAAGIGLVAAGHAIAVALAEADEMTITPSRVPALVTPAVAAPSAPSPDVDDTSVWAPPPPEAPADGPSADADPPPEAPGAP